VPAVYELFGDKAGLVREIFFEGFRRLGAQLEQVPSSADPHADLMAAMAVFRAFVRARPRARDHRARPGLARQETAGWLGPDAESIDRRWALAFERLLR
jgi:AcrR family transcriptional regulator